MLQTAWLERKCEWWSLHYREKSVEGVLCSSQAVSVLLEVFSVRDSEHTEEENSLLYIIALSRPWGVFFPNLLRWKYIFKLNKICACVTFLLCLSKCFSKDTRNKFFCVKKKHVEQHLLPLLSYAIKYISITSFNSYEEDSFHTSIIYLSLCQKIIIRI